MSKIDELQDMDDGEITTARDRILTVLIENDDLLVDSIEGEHKYAQRTLKAVEERWGEDAVPNSGTKYVSSIKGKHLEELQELAEEVEQDETVTDKRGNTTYKGSPTGVDTTSGQATQTIKERPVKESRISITIPKSDAKSFLTNDDDTVVKQQILNALLEKEE